MKRQRSQDDDDDGGDDDGDILLLNVRGRPFATTFGTVRSAPGSYLATLFQKGGVFRAPKRDADGRYFIDRDPECFSRVLEFLGCGSRLLPRKMSAEEWLQLRHEASFYLLPELESQLLEYRNVDFDDGDPSAPRVRLQQASRFAGVNELWRVGFNLRDICHEGVQAEDLLLPDSVFCLTVLYGAGYTTSRLFGLKVVTKLSSTVLPQKCYFIYGRMERYGERHKSVCVCSVKPHQKEIEDVRSGGDVVSLNSDRELKALGPNYQVFEPWDLNVIP